MHRPGVLEAATLASFVGAALLALPAAFRRPSLRPVSAGLVVLAAVDVARLWTRGTRLDVLLFVAWAGIAAAPTLPALARRSSWPAYAGSFGAGAGVALAYLRLGAIWTEVLRGSRLAAGALAAWALASRLVVRGLRRLELAEALALVHPASQAADLLSVWLGGERYRDTWIARVGSLTTNVVLGAILLACWTRPRSSESC